MVDVARVAVIVPKIDGSGGKVLWAYATAALIDDYTATPIIGARRDITSWRLRATVTMTDRFRLSQRPLLFLTTINGRAVRWPIVDFDIQGGTLIGNLGPLEAENRAGDIVICRDLSDPKPVR